MRPRGPENTEPVTSLPRPVREDGSDSDRGTLVHSKTHEGRRRLRCQINGEDAKAPGMLG
jgi:hypothetical protein